MFRVVLVMVSLVVQMVGFLFVGGGMGDGSADVVCAGCVVIVSGVGGVADADGGVLTAGAGGGVLMVRVPAPRCRVISSLLLAEGAAGVAAGEGGGMCCCCCGCWCCPGWLLMVLRVMLMLRAVMRMVRSL